MVGGRGVKGVFHCLGLSFHGLGPGCLPYLSLMYPWSSPLKLQGNMSGSGPFSYSVVSDSLPPHGLQHARLHCPSPTPRPCSNSWPLSWRHYPTISSSVVPFSCFQSFPASGSFPVSQLFASGGQGVGFQRQHQSFQWIVRTDLLKDGLVGSHPLTPSFSALDLSQHQGLFQWVLF